MPKRLPRPFVKPSIEIVDGPSGRTWQHVPAGKLGVDDIVPDYGKVTEVRMLNPYTVSLLFLNGAVVHADASSKTFAFTNG